LTAPRILAIETSCDETGVAVVSGGRRITANQVATQMALHATTGGIVPEVAARQQLRWIVPSVRAAMSEAEVTSPSAMSTGNRASRAALAGRRTNARTSQAPPRCRHSWTHST